MVQLENGLHHFGVSNCFCHDGVAICDGGSILKDRTDRCIIAIEAKYYLTQDVQNNFVKEISILVE